MKSLHMVAFLLVVVGALNWGLVALGYNLVEMVLGKGTLTSLVYLLVGASGVYLLLTHRKDCLACMNMMGGKKKR